jgi:hypothetical protein
MKLILGHNQFIGISHTSYSDSKKKEARFSDVENIYSVVEKAADIGFKSMLIEPHPRLMQFIQEYNKRRTFDMKFYLQIPNVQNYVQKMNDGGIAGIISEFRSRLGTLGASAALLKSGMMYLRRDYLSLALYGIKLEVQPFKDLELEGILLHNVVTDLLLSLSVTDTLQEFHNFIIDEYKVTPGFVTLNLPLLMARHKQMDGSDLIMTPINPLGYDMNPDISTVENSLRSSKSKIIAMNVLAGGSVSIDKTASYLSKFENVEYACVGASSEGHLREIVTKIK